MVFIDGGYLRARLKEWFGHDRFDLFNLSWGKLAGGAQLGTMSAELVRTYFYDAAFPEGDPERPAQDSYFAKLRSFQLTQIRLGRLIRAESGTRQKGVDVLMAIDMLSKAYEGQFDIAVVLAGDDDFVDIVQSIRDEGKRVCGAFSESNVSPRLHDVFDRWIPLTRAALEPYMLAPDWKQGEKARSA